MKKLLLLIAIAGLSLLGCSAMQGDNEAAETKVPFAQLPAAVKATLTREAEGVAIATVDQESVDGKPAYEADAVIAGTPYEIIVAADGKLLRKQIDKEAQEEAAATQKTKN